MSRLQQHLRSSGIRQQDFAERVGVTQGTISRLANGKSRLSLELAKKIERETGGAVPVSYWAELLELAPPTSPTPPEETAA